MKLIPAVAWHVASDARLKLPNEGDDWLPYGEVLWDLGSTRVVARIENIQGSIRVSQFEVSGALEVPAAVRRLPSNLQVMAALRGLGNKGISLIGYLLGDLENLSAAFTRETAGVDGQPSPSAVDRALERYLQDVNRRPRARIQRQVDDVGRMLSEGKKTSEVVEALVTGGVSQATAYRRIREARHG